MTPTWIHLFVRRSYFSIVVDPEVDSGPDYCLLEMYDAKKCQTVSWGDHFKNEHEYIFIVMIDNAK